MSAPRWLTAPARWSVAAQTFALQVLVALLVVGVGTLAAYAQAQRAGTQEATARATAVAETVASTPSVVAGVRGGAPGPGLQAFAEEVRRRTRTDFVVVMSPDGVRYTHPDPRQIGGQFIGHIAAARAGGTVVEDYTGTLGPSRRVVVPVRDGGGSVVGLVAVGIRKSAVSERLRSQLPALLLAGLAAALLSGLGMALVTRRIRRQTHGLGERQLQEMVEYYDAVLHAVTEGLLLTDLDGRLRLANDEAVRLLGLPQDARGRPLAELGLSAPLLAALTDGEPRQDELHVTSARVLVLNTARAQWQGRALGLVATVRDRTDLEHLTGELDSARGLTEALRSQAHESANRLHAIVSLIELGHPDRALAFATDELQVSQRLTDSVVGSVGEPALTALLLGKAAQAGERGIDFRISDDAVWPQDVAPVRDVVTIVGNLIDNAFDAVTSAPGQRRVEVSSRIEDGHVVLSVADSGPGLPPDAADEAFRRGFSTKEQGGAGRRGIGLALVAQSVARLDGSLEVAGPPGAEFTVRLPLGAQIHA
ncbi:sensor histidine kinase regulating citrate/malate metabolism [Phycicoccus badiiscoriae]|uniref:histidine kinase n=1 Tax=Pedococcus badiiscoriae TaxID=642776 RepID=A0A852WHX1_9MICO|nr:sensor histidine kinase regulating citrate/malate metabolism [Pedococcus badiiscoriae]